MAQKRSTHMHALRKVALAHPHTEEGVACEGTPVERRTVKAKKKAFVFLGMGDAMVKLRESLPEANALARKNPAAYRVGANGWVKATFGPEGPPLDLLAKWIAESYRLAIGTGPEAKTEKDTKAKATPKRTKPARSR